MRVESDPTQKYWEQFDFMFWGSLPYHHPVVGWPSDVESISRPAADRFFATYYAPNNITAVLVGDFDPDEASSVTAAAQLDSTPLLMGWGWNSLTGSEPPGPPASTSPGTYSMPNWVSTRLAFTIS